MISKVNLKHRDKKIKKSWKKQKKSKFWDWVILPGGSRSSWFLLWHRWGRRICRIALIFSHCDRNKRNEPPKWSNSVRPWFTQIGNHPEFKNHQHCDCISMIRELNLPTSLQETFISIPKKGKAKELTFGESAEKLQSKHGLGKVELPRTFNRSLYIMYWFQKRRRPFFKCFPVFLCIFWHQE